MAKIVVFLFFVLIAVFIVKTILKAIRHWMDKREPWSLVEENETTRFRYVAMRPGHVTRELTPWMEMGSYSELAWGARSDAEAVVSDMNYGNKRLKK